MIRRVYFLVMVILLALAAPRVQAARIVVLGEEPVAEFTLPDGSVLKNAYVWRRTSEGLMIIHDDGQFFLNYKTLPDAWRRAYGIDESVEQVPMAITKRYDQYSLYPVLEHIEGMPRTTVTFIESERYKGQADADVLQACALQALLDGNQTTASRLNGVATDYFTNAVPLDLSTFYTGCVACASNGVISGVCKVCKGTGKCVKCGGKGKVKTEFGKRQDDESGRNRNIDESDDEDDKEKDNFSAGPSAFDEPDTLRCVNCKGTGKCPVCRGAGKRSHACPECKGKGILVLTDKVKAALELRIKRLNAVRAGLPIDSIPLEPAEPAPAD